MSRKHFELKTKLKYVKLHKDGGITDATIIFLYEFEDRYLDKWLLAPRGKANYYNPASQAKSRINDGTSKYNLFGEAGLINMTGKTSDGKNGRPKKVSINDLTEHDRALYQEIMEDVLREQGINPKVIQDKIKERKKQGKTFDNHKQVTTMMNINRTSMYKNYIAKPTNNLTALEVNNVIGLTAGMKSQIAASDNVVGRDKLYKYYCNTVKHISSYVWRLHGESLQYKSRAYVRKHSDNPPREKKYKGVYCADSINFNYQSAVINEKGFADISYVKIAGAGGYLHVITESFANSVVAGTLTRERTSASTIKLLEIAYANTQAWPKIFHTDHGVEYANHNLTAFLEQHGIIQSMSPKASPLANRPIEFLFGLIKREKLNFYDLSKLNNLETEKLLKEYFSGYHKGRSQSSLQNKTPLAKLMQAEKNVMCLNLIS